jgi:hypothetical protein
MAATTHLDSIFNEDHSLVDAEVLQGHAICEQRGILQMSTRDRVASPLQDNPAGGGELWLAPEAPTLQCSTGHLLGPGWGPSQVRSIEAGTQGTRPREEAHNSTAQGTQYRGHTGGSNILQSTGTRCGAQGWFLSSGGISTSVQWVSLATCSAPQKVLCGTRSPCWAWHTVLSVGLLPLLCCPSLLQPPVQHQHLPL